MNGKYDCPNCGGPVSFQSSIAVFAICPHCRSMVVRHDVNVEAIGQMAQLPPDLSPLQIGTRGEFGGRSFIILGRVRLVHEEGSWNEWYASFGDDQYGWVAEAQGIFMVSFEIAPPPEFPKSRGGLHAGVRVKIAEESFQFTDSRETECVGAEGELPFTAPAGRKATSIDLTGTKGRFACAEYSDAGTRLFVGNYARFDGLKFSGLREVPGWSDGAIEPGHHQTTSLKCPECSGTVTLRAAGLSMSATCGSCGSLIDTATPDLALIRRAHEKLRFAPVIPLGRRGVLFDVNYEVIGFQRVKDQYSGWFEYLLFNPWQGFAWLVTYNNHWSFVQRLFDQPTVKEGIFTKSVPHAKFNGESYRMFAVNAVSTEYVVGEFYWKVRFGMSANVTDFVCPPRILSREAYMKTGEQTWSRGEYVEPEIIEKAFNLEEPLREPLGIYLNQPNPHAEKSKHLKWVVPLLAVIMLVIQIISASRAARQQVFNATYSYQRLGTTNPIVVTQPFEIPGGKQAVAFDLYAPLNNSWLELGLDLVNIETHQTVASFEKGIEYYHGYDDGSWSEGSQTGRRIVPMVSPGKYYLTIDASGDPAVAAMPYTVTVVRDVVVWSNFWIGLALLFACPLYRWIRAYSFEYARWSESDYSPYESSSSDDD